MPNNTAKLGMQCTGCHHAALREEFETGRPQSPLKCPKCGRRHTFAILFDYEIEAINSRPQGTEK